MRMLMSLIVVAGFLSIFSCEQTEHLKPAPLLPMEDFFRNPEKTYFKLSPNGEYIAYMQPWQDRLNVHVQKIGTDDVVRITTATERDISGFMWANNQRIVYSRDKAGDENWRIFAVSIDGSNNKELTPFEGVRAQLLDPLEDDQQHMLIGMNNRDSTLFDPYRINIDSGEMKIIAENPGNITEWITDNNGDLRLAVATDGVNQSLLYRQNETETFKIVITLNFKETLRPLFFTFDNQYIWAASNLGRDKTAIVKFDPVSAQEIEVIYQHPEVDVSKLLRSKKREVITGVIYVTETKHYHFFDDERKKLQKILELKLPGYEVVVTSFSKDERKALVRTYSDKTMGAYYFYNRDSQEFYKLSDISPWLDPEHMADMQPIKYKSRDGKLIRGYLTLPKGQDATHLPVVVNVHGGPWTRDYWGFNSEVQFLANRGYAVLQINFRGSTGYGRKFWASSFKNWGKTMQADISDGVNWLIEQDIADSLRIGIYGASYGGYTALAGLAFTSELYACGVSYVGVSNLFTLLESIPPYWEPMRKQFYEMIGHPQQDKELLEAVSPLFHVDLIKAPLLIAHGANDVRVKQSEADLVVAALKKQGIDVTYILKENEGHGFRNEENRFDFYRAMEAFLGKHLDGKVMKN